jgi:hypothetical protein
VLARLNQVNGVEYSFTNESGTLIRLSLRPRTDPGRVTAEASRALREQVGDRVGVQLGRREATAALQREEWRNESRVTESWAVGMRAAPDVRTPARRGWLTVLLGCVAVGLWLLWRRHSKASAEREYGLQA